MMRKKRCFNVSSDDVSWSTRVYEKLVRASLNVPQSASLWVLFPMSRKFLVVSSRNYPLETTQGLDAAKELQNKRL